MFQCFHLQSKSPWILEENASDFSWYDQARERPTCQGLINFLWVFLVWSGHFISFCPIILTTLSKPSHAQVFQVLKNQDQETCRGSRHLRFLGNPVCNRGFMKLFGVGKHRFNTLSTSARRGDEYCPYDGRYIARGKRLPTPKWEKVHGFLYQLYQEAGEHIPDKFNSNKRPRHAEKKTDDPNLDRSNLRHLPHGSINDYWRQCTAAFPELGVSRKLFCKESLLQIHSFKFFTPNQNYFDTILWGVSHWKENYSVPYLFNFRFGRQTSSIFWESVFSHIIPVVPSA